MIILKDKKDGTIRYLFKTKVLPSTTQTNKYEQFTPNRHEPSDTYSRLLQIGGFQVREQELKAQIST